MATTERPALDLLDGDFYIQDPYSTYAWFREHEPVAWDMVNELWGVFRYDDVIEVEKRKDLFISSDRRKGGYRPNIPADPSIIGLDDPVHAKRRNLISRRFTPRAVSAWEPHVRAVTGELLDAAVAEGEVEIVDRLASVLPARMIGRLLGFPDDRWPELRDWSERTIMLGGGPRYYNKDGMAAAEEFSMACAELYTEKQRCPADDVVSLWTSAEIDGIPLGVEDVISDCLLVLDGGAETTRTVIARTMLTLADRPDQWRLLQEGADLSVATEEFIRWVTPVHNMCRVASIDVEVAGAKVHAGEQLVLMYASANRDPAHFHEPERFDVTRQPNNHLAFGFGIHFCLGAALARLEIRIFFEELLRRVTWIRVVPGSVQEMPNAFVFGVKRATVQLVAS